MGIKETIDYYNGNLNYKIAKNRNEQIKNLVEEIGKKVAKGYRQRVYNFTFTSQDLRSLVMKLSKIHKAMNKKVDFLEFEKRIDKLAQKNKGQTETETHTIHWDIFKDQVKQEQELMVILQNIQWAVSKLSMLCTVVSVYEMTTKREKDKKEKEDSEILTHAIFEALIEGSNL